MANQWYPEGKACLAEAGLNWVSDTVRAALVDTTLYTYSAADKFFSDIPAGAIVGTPVALSGKTNVLGLLDCDDIVFTLVSGPQYQLLVYYKWTGTGSTSRLLLKDDTGDNLPGTPNGDNITVEIHPTLKVVQI